MHAALRTSTLCAPLAVLSLVLLSTHSLYGQVVEQSKRVQTTSYSGFELPPSDEWTNESETVIYTPDTGPDFLVLSQNFGQQQPPAVPTIDLGDARMKLMSSSNGATVNATAAFSERSRPVAFEDPDLVYVTSENGKSDEPTATFSHYAEVTNQDDLLLSRGAAHVSQQNRMDDTSLNASGQLWSDSELLADIPFGAGTGTANSSISATYYVAEEMDFVLSAILGSTKETGLSFSFSDLETSYSTSGNSQRFEWCGTLLPGEFTLSLQAVSRSQNVTQYDGSEWDEHAGGFSEYEIHFQAFDIGANSAPSSVAAVPEPNFSDIALWIATLSLIIRRQRRKRTAYV